MFIEVTLHHSSKKILINVNEIVYVDTKEKDGYGNIINGSLVYITSLKDSFTVKESYEDIKNKLKFFDKVLE